MSSSGESSASSSRSSTPEPITQKSKGKGKQRAGEPRNEGDDPHWAFEPPAGAVAIDNTTVSVGHFDWDAVHADEDAEVWLIRVPEGVKAKHLEGAVLDAKSLSTSSRTSKVGSLARKHTTYDIWSVGDAAEEENADPEAAAATPAGGEEIRALSCLLPRKKKKGDLYLAPKPIARHIVLSARELQPTAPPSTIPLQNPPRQSYPEDMLTHKFMPYGSLMATGDIDEDVAMDEPIAEEPAVAYEDGKKKKKEKKEKKRKEEGETTAKAHKRKVEADEESTPKKAKKKRVL